MSEHVAIYTGPEPAAKSLVDFLAERGIETRETRRPGPTMFKARARGHRIRVEVPRAELESARAHAIEWRAPRRAHARERGRRLAGAFVLSLLPPIVWVGAHLGGLQNVPFPDPSFVAGLWMLALVFFTSLLGRRRRAERVDRPV